MANGPIKCTDPVGQTDCCGNHKLEAGEQCDSRDSDCPQCYQKCDFNTCQCYDFRPQLSGCNYYDYCSIVDGDNCDCAEDFCNATLHPTDPCHNVLESVCGDPSKICHRSFTCAIPRM